MTYILQPPKRLDARIELPASKSISNRALIINALAGNEVRPKNLSDCDDTEVIVEALNSMPDVIDIKAAGTAMRFLTAYLAITEGEHIITGTERMKQRPIAVLVDALRYLGAKIEYVEKEGYPPLRIKGQPLDGGSIEVAGDISSQYISALLMIAPRLKHGLKLKLTGEIASRPYIDLTLWMMGVFGAEAEWTDIDTISVKAVPYRCKGYTIESDWSAASYWYEMIALSGDRDASVRLTGLKDDSKQGDSVVRYIFSLMGVKTTFMNEKNEVRLSRHRTKLPRLEYDFYNSPDLAQTFVVACSLMNIPFHFRGLASLKIKETDRIEALKTEMRKLGIVIDDIDGNQLVWDGARCEPTLEPIDTYNDHRMALAFAPAAFVFPGLKIRHPEVVSKSYPRFWDDIRKTGFIINEE
jgi:3-phosphoshikimate 1-carboxyvinyltransferase